MKGLRKLLERFETTMTAEAFAEEGEFETARKIMREKKSVDKQLRKKADKEQRARLTAN